MLVLLIVLSLDEDLWLSNIDTCIVLSVTEGFCSYTSNHNIKFVDDMLVMASISKTGLWFCVCPDLSDFLLRRSKIRKASFLSKWHVTVSVFIYVCTSVLLKEVSVFHFCLFRTREYFTFAFCWQTYPSTAEGELELSVAALARGFWVMHNTALADTGNRHSLASYLLAFPCVTRRYLHYYYRNRPLW